MEPFLDEGDQDIDRDGDPDLRLDRVLRSAEETFDPKMLLDPFEEQLHLPARLVQRADGGCRQGELIGQKHQCLAGLRVLEADAAQMCGIIPLGVKAVQGDGLVADNAGGAVRPGRIETMRIQIRLGAGDEEGARQMQDTEPLEIDIAPIHDVDRPHFGNQQVERMHVVQLAVGDVDEARNAASGAKPGRLPESVAAVQIDTTPHRLESRFSHGFQINAYQINRTLVSLDDS